MELLASDLRLGNLVGYNGSRFKVYSIEGVMSRKGQRFDGKELLTLFDNGLIVVTADEVEGIPIDEKMLVRLGFVESGFDTDNRHLSLRYRFLNFDSDESVKFGKVYLTINKMDIICEYVHQVQNLHYILTGKELTLKDN